MSAVILPFAGHQVISRRGLRQNRKKVVRGNCLIRDLFDFRRQLPGRPGEATPKAADRGAIAAQLGCQSFIGEQLLSHPVSECHAVEGALSARACQAQCAPASMDSKMGRAHHARMPVKRAAQRAIQPKTKTAEVRGPWKPAHIAAWRIFRNDMSQETLAHRIKKDRTIVTKLENGKLGYSQYHLEACARALECEPWQLLVQNPFDKTWVWQLFHSLDSKSRDELIEIAKNFKK
jgi:ribosome-binding protein aMBF1 (putative translation factor)